MAWGFKTLESEKLFVDLKRIIDVQMENITKNGRFLQERMR